MTDASKEHRTKRRGKERRRRKNEEMGKEEIAKCGKRNKEKKMGSDTSCINS